MVTDKTDQFILSVLIRAIRGCLVLHFLSSIFVIVLGLIPDLPSLTTEK
jgi:hypothetical protein